MPDVTEYRGFTVTWDHAVNQLLLTAGATASLSSGKESRNNPVQIKVVWDTGAMTSCISEKLMERLGLSPRKMDRPIFIDGIGGRQETHITYISLLLPNHIQFNNRRVYTVKSNDGWDMLVGMDIISKGKFTVGEVDGKPLFSFNVPLASDDPKAEKKASLFNSRSQE